MTREFRLTACDDIAGIRILSLVGPADFSFRAGQYVVFEHPDGGIPMSIASSPGRLPHIVFHYRSTPGVPEAARFDALLDAGGPFGS